jgi:molecular chaperone GrpE
VRYPEQSGSASTGKDDDRPETGDRPAQRPATGPVDPAVPAEDLLAPQAAGDTAAMLDELAKRLGKMEELLAEFHRRSSHRETIIDRLHEENQQFRGGIGRLILEPVVADLIRLHDQLSREVRRLGTDGQDEQLLWSFAEDVAQILDRCGIEVFSAEPGDPFEAHRHRPLAVVSCHDQSRHNTVAEVIAAGFLERETGRVRRPVQARFYQYIPGLGAAGPDHGTAEPVR